MYLPGLPAVTAELGSDAALTSQTLTVFFLFMAVGTLIWGTLSDKTGRRPILLGCSLVATLACLSCAASPTIDVLLILRSLQGLASGGMVAGGMAIVKDCFEGDQMAKTLAFTQAVAMVAPVVAPLLGVVVLALGGWRGSFLAIAALLILCLGLVLVMKETLPAEERVTGSLVKPFLGGFALLLHGSFALPLIVGSLFNAPFMAYIGNASYIYEEHFGVSTALFGVIFAITSVSAILSPLIYMKYESVIKVPRLMTVFIAVLGILAFPLVLVGNSGPWPFMACMMVMAFLGAFVRPMTASFLLGPLTSGIGTASSLISFTAAAFGCVGLFAGSMGLGMVEGVQSVAVVSVLVMIGCWAVYLRRYHRPDKRG